MINWRDFDNMVDWDKIPDEPIISLEQKLGKVDVAIIQLTEKLAALDNGSMFDELYNNNLYRNAIVAELERLEMDRELFIRIKSMQQLLTV